jgi:hypothetical protein
MKLTSAHEVDIEVDDNNRRLCSKACRFWQKPVGHVHNYLCLLFWTQLSPENNRLRCSRCLKEIPSNE